MRKASDSLLDRCKFKDDGRAIEDPLSCRGRPRGIVGGKSECAIAGVSLD